MNVTQFRRMRENRWRQLEHLTKTSKQFADSKTLYEFVRLYRQTASDLAYARTYFPNEEVTLYLNNLVSSAYPVLYRFKKGGQGNLWSFLGTSFPMMFREFFMYILLAALVSTAGAVYGFILVHHSPQAAYHLLPPNFVRQFQPDKAGPHAVVAPVMSTVIMTHNMLVALEAFVGGLTLGLYTLYALWQNGLILGILAALFQAKGRSLMFWSLIVPHGVTELTAIFIAGGAGLLFAHHLMRPGSMARLRAIQFGATKAVQLFLGTVPMLMIAGTIEGFLTPSNAPMWVKFGTATLTGIAWILYFTLAGRQQQANDASATYVGDMLEQRPQQRHRAMIRRY